MKVQQPHHCGCPFLLSSLEITPMKALLKTGISALALAGILASNAHAGGGVFDALDPCIKARDDFRAERAAIVQQLDRAVQDADQAPATAEYRAAWMKAKKAQLRPIFDSLVAPELKANGIQDMDAAYEAWFGRQLAALGNDGADKLVTLSFHQELKQVRLEQRAQGQAALQSAQDDLDKSCKMDAGNQVLRGALTIALAPIEAVSRNLEIAKRETGVGAKALAATTGISVDAINQNGGVFGGGLSGGPGSFFRKTLGIRF
jgi:hypothetical protein